VPASRRFLMREWTCPSGPPHPADAGCVATSQATCSRQPNSRCSQSAFMVIWAIFRHRPFAI